MTTPQATLPFSNEAILAADARTLNNNYFAGDFILNRFRFAYADLLRNSVPNLRISGSRFEFIDGSAATSVFSATATTYIYNRTASNTNGTADQWSAGTNWNAIPVSASNTTLTFGNGASLAAGATIFTNNDFVGDFKLNRLNFTYTGPGAFPLPEVTLSGNRLEFISDGATTPVLNINPTGQVNLTIRNDLLLTNNLSVSLSSTEATLSGIISGGGGLTTTGGALVLSGANTYSGGTVLSSGALYLHNSGSGGTSSAIGTGPLTINGGAISNSSGTDVTLSTNNAQIWAGDFTFSNSVGGGSVNLGTGPVTLTGDRTITLTGGSSTLTIGGAISDGGSGFSLTINDAGDVALALTGVSTYSGGTTITSGGLRVANIGNAGAPGLGTGGITLGTWSETATLSYIGSGETTDKVITLGGTGFMQIHRAFASGTDLLKFTADLAVTGTGPKTLVLSANTSAVSEFAGKITGNDVSIVLENIGTWILSGANTFTTKVTINAGTLSVSSINSVVGGSASSNLGAPTTVATGTIDFGGPLLPLPGGTVRGSATLQYTGTGETTDRVIHLNNVGIGTLEQAGTGLLKFTSDLTVTGSNTLGLNGSTSGTGEFAGIIADPTSSGETKVSKSGTGTWSLSAANTYTGETQVFGGTLLINGNQSAATGAVTVYNTGTLGGTGTIGGAVRINAGTITAREVGSVGTLTLNSNTTFVGAIFCPDCGGDGPDLISSSAAANEIVPATYLVDINGATSDKLVISGMLDLTNSLDQILFNGTPDGSTTYVLATYSSVSGVFDFGSAPAGYQLNYGANQLELVPVPEPSTFAAAMLATVAILFLGRRSRQCR